MGDPFIQIAAMIVNDRLLSRGTIIISATQRLRPLLPDIVFALEIELIPARRPAITKEGNRMRSGAATMQFRQKPDVKITKLWDQERRFVFNL